MDGAKEGEGGCFKDPVPPTEKQRFDEEMRKIVNVFEMLSIG